MNTNGVFENDVKIMSKTLVKDNNIYHIYLSGSKKTWPGFNRKNRDTPGGVDKRGEKGGK